MVDSSNDMDSDDDVANNFDDDVGSYLFWYRKEEETNGGN